MRAFAPKQKPVQKTKSAGYLKPSRTLSVGSHEVSSLLRLQRTIGDQAVQPLLQAKPDGAEVGSDTRATARFGHDFSRIPVYAKVPVKTQTKPTVNTPGDVYEQEADRVADEVTHMQEPPSQRACVCPECRSQVEQLGQKNKPMQTRRAQESDTQAPVAAGILDQELGSAGQALDAAVRAFMEPRFGHDFSQIRVHTDSRADESARALNARAYTLGNQIAFAAGQYAPERSEGRKLLAHELTHVVQQRQSRTALPQLQPAPQQPLGPIDQARADAADALGRAAGRVKDAIDARDGIGIVPHDVDEALARFFPGTSYESLNDLLARIEPMIGWIKDIPARKIPTPVPAGTPHARQHRHNIGRTPAFAVSTPEFPPPHYIALYDDWYADPDLQATRLLHEAYHFSFPTIRGHNPNDPWTNPFAYQRFVSILGGLKFN